MKNIIKTYPCGLRMIVRPMPGFKSVATSIYIGVGSRDELKNEHGLSHFVEHMLFKGTTTRTAEQIAQTLSGLGVEYNAFTSTSATCYHTRGLVTNLDTCCDILSDMYFNMKFQDDDFNREAEVICQEIVWGDDNPRLALRELCAMTFFAGTQYGHPIIGNAKSVRGFKPADIHAYVKKHYIAPKTIVSFAGDVTVEQAERMVKKYFLTNFKEVAKPNLRVLGDKKIMPPQSFAKKKKKINQQNVAVLFPVVNNINPEKYPLSFLSRVLASDMSSRLFVSVREKLGLVYGISGGQLLTNIGGYFTIWFSCTPANTEKVLETIAAEIKLIKDGGVTEEEIQKVKNIESAECLFEFEDTEKVNIRNARLLAEFNEVETPEQHLAKINRVTAADVLTVARKYLNYDNAIVAIVGSDINVKPFEILN